MLIALPEILTLVLILFVLMVDLFFEKRVWVTLGIALLGLLGVLIVLGNSLNLPSQMAFNGHYKFDDVAVLLKIVVTVLGMVAMLYSYQILKNHDRRYATNQMLKGEYFTLLLLILLGMMVMISAGSLLTAYLGLELSSLSIYGLVAWNRKDSNGSEAAMKYFVLGSIASGLLLYGMSLLYGVSGSLLIADIVSNEASNRIILLLGFVFILVGVAFKLGVVPFHMWLPDVYQGASIATTMFIASVAKVAIFGLLFRLWIETIGSVESDGQMQMILKIIALGSIVLGNIVAIAQKNIRRLLAYSSIAHMGFVMLGVMSATQDGYSAALFYVLIYALTSLAVFALIAFFTFQNREIENITEFKGLAQIYPWQAGLLFVLMFSLVGIPPTAGFYAKLVVLQSVVDVGLFYEAIIALVFSVIGSFYYLRVLRYMYFDESEHKGALGFALSLKSWFIIALLIANVGLLVFLGLFPATLLEWCKEVI